MMRSGRPRRWPGIEECICFDGYKLLPRLVREGSGSYTWVNFHVQCELLYDMELAFNLTFKARTEYQIIEIIEVAQPYGRGKRLLFRCPSPECGKIVVHLYIPPGCTTFGCRNCHHLIYKSSRESHRGEALLRYVASNAGVSLKEVKMILERKFSG